MPKSVFTDPYAQLLETLVTLRKERSVTQAQLSKALGRPQPFISFVERGERRIDVIEFCVIVRALGADPIEVLRPILKKVPKSMKI